jgi:hypothetical protein
MMIDPNEPRVPPNATAEGEEQDAVERSATERGPRERAPRREEPDPQDEEGWTQPESSAQKGAERDAEEG